MRTALIKEYYEGPEYLKQLRARADVLSMCEKDPLARARVILDVWAVDPIRFFEDVLFLKIPEFGNAIKPYFLFEYQKNILRRLQDAEMSGEDAELLIDKLRGMGMTWLIAGYMYWRWLFTPNWSGFILSRTESEVDDGTETPDSSIFGKIRFFIKHTPKWVLPEGFQSKGKKGTSTDSMLRLINPALSSSINGSSTNSNAGRSRRYSFVFIDECFYIERFLEVRRSLLSVARTMVYVSSVKAGRVAKDFKEKSQESGNYITLSWRDHPWKDEEWFKQKEKEAEFDPESMKELMVDYSIDARSQYYPEVRQSKVEPVEYNRSLPLYGFLDVGRGDLTVLGWMQFTGSSLTVIEAYASKNKALEWYIPFMNREVGFNPDKYTPANILMLNRVRSFEKPHVWFGEQAHFSRVMPSNTSIASELAKNGVRLMYNQYAINHEPRRHATSLMLPKTIFNSESEGVMELYDAIATSRYTASIAATSKQTVMKPVHDIEIADWRAAFENGCANIGRVMKKQREDLSTEMKDSGFAGRVISMLRV